MVRSLVRCRFAARTITNRVSAVLANLPAGEPDPLRRLGLIREEMASLKHSHQAVGAEILTGMLGFAPPMWLAADLDVFVGGSGAAWPSSAADDPGGDTALRHRGEHLRSRRARSRAA